MKKKYLFLPVIAVLLFSSALHAAEESERLHDRAKNLYDVGDYRLALNLYERLLAADPDDGTALDLAGWCLRYLGDRKSAEETFHRALEILKGDDAQWALIGLGETYLDGKIYASALATFKRALEVITDNREAEIRALQGAIFAGAMADLPDESHIARLQKIDPEAAELIVRKIREVTASLPVASEDLQAENPQSLSNMRDRQEEVFRTSISAEGGTADIEEFASADAPGLQTAAPDKGKKAGTQAKKTPAKTGAKRDEKSAGPVEKRQPAPVRINGIELGSNIDEALKKLADAGHSVTAPFTSDGKFYYAVEDIRPSFPTALSQDIVKRRFYVTAFRGGVLSVSLQADYVRNHTFEEEKEILRGELPRLLGSNGRATTSNSVFSFESGIARSNTYGIWVRLTDKMDGTCSLEVEHVDLRGLSYYWMSGGKQ